MAAHGRARVRGSPPRQRPRPARRDPTAPRPVAGAEVRPHEFVRQTGGRSRCCRGRRARRDQPVAAQQLQCGWGRTGSFAERFAERDTDTTPIPEPVARVSGLADRDAP